MLLAVAGVKLQNRLETRGDLLAELQHNPALIRLIRPSQNQITSLAVNPRGQLLATSDSAGSCASRTCRVGMSAARPSRWAARSPKKR